MPLQQPPKRSNPFNGTTYQWRTRSGAVACEFPTEDQARSWINKCKLNQKVSGHYELLELFKVERIAIETKI